MTNTPIICHPTRDTFVRFAIVLAAFFGFGLYFFYDGAVGYRKANEVYFSYQAFAELGKEFTLAAEISNDAFLFQFASEFNLQKFLSGNCTKLDSAAEII